MNECASAQVHLNIYGPVSLWKKNVQRRYEVRHALQQEEMSVDVDFPLHPSQDPMKEV